LGVYDFCDKRCLLVLTRDWRVNVETTTVKRGGLHADRLGNSVAASTISAEEPVMESDHESLMRRAIALSREGAERGGTPFGAVVAFHGEVVGEAFNEARATNDPTAHAEIVAIRRAGARLGRFWLTECVLYSSAEPCPMCLAAALWARIDKVFFGNGSEATENVGFIDRRILEELKRPRQERTMPSEQLLADEAGLAIQEWQDAKVKRNRPEFT
jgi:tRNA(Arg) A34 adenosine deaminase TadA